MTTPADSAAKLAALRGKTTDSAEGRLVLQSLALSPQHEPQRNQLLILLAQWDLALANRTTGRDKAAIVSHGLLEAIGGEFDASLGRLAAAIEKHEREEMP